MYIPNDVSQNTPSVDYNQWLKRLDFKLHDTTNLKSIEVPKVVKPTNNKTLI